MNDLWNIKTNVDPVLINLADDTTIILTEPTIDNFINTMRQIKI